MYSLQKYDSYKQKKKAIRQGRKRMTYLETHIELSKKKLNTKKPRTGLKPKAKRTPEKKLKAILLELCLIFGKIKKTNAMGKGFCITCALFDYWRTMTGGHFIPQKRGLSCKFELDNINLQCNNCNGKMNQGEQYKHGLYIDREYGEGRADELHAQSRELRKRKRQELEDTIEYVEDLIAELCKQNNQERVQRLLDYILKDAARKSKCKNLLLKINNG